MRRLLLTVLLALLPLQFSWAAVASYCAHKSESQKSRHLGHHQHHDHAAASWADDRSPDKAGATMDVDCGHCHGHCAAMLMQVASVSMHAEVGRHVVPNDLAASARIPPPPERPQWAALA
jgi:hypothetical protein